MPWNKIGIRELDPWECPEPIMIEKKDIKMEYLYDDTKVEELEIEVPEWIDQDITAYDVAAILDGLRNGMGSAQSGSYMPASWNDTALNTMTKWHTQIFEYLENRDSLPETIEVDNWAGMAVQLVSRAVDTWAQEVIDEVTHELHKKRLHDNLKLLIDSVNGIYTPKVFAEWLKGSNDLNHNIPQGELDILSKGPNHKEYLEVWGEVLQIAEITTTEECYVLHQTDDGDLFLFPKKYQESLEEIDK